MIGGEDIGIHQGNAILFSLRLTPIGRETGDGKKSSTQKQLTDRDILNKRIW
jgi:hypothetical protein